MKSFLYSVITGILVLTIASCINKKDKTKGTTIYIEVEEINLELEKCFTEKLFNTWASPEEMNSHPMSVRYKGSKPEDCHIFKSFDEFDMDKDSTGAIKIIVSSDAPGGDTANTFFQLRKFQLEKEGIWTESLNIGHFRVQDRPNDKINPGKIDEEEICDMMVRFVIKASFKP